MCRVSEFAKDLSVGVVVFSLMALSYDRYIAIVKAVQTYTGAEYKSKRVIILLIAIWLVALCLALPSALFPRLKTTQIPSSNGTIFINGTFYREIQICYPFPKEFGTLYPKVYISIYLNKN